MNIPSISRKLVETLRELRIFLRQFGRSFSREDVHTLRRLIHRVETIVKVLESDIGSHPYLLKDLAEIRKRAGAVRDIDVLTKLASALPIDQEDECLFKILRYLSFKRDQRAEKLLRAIARYGSDVHRYLKGFSELIEEGSKHQSMITDAENAAPMDLAPRIFEELATWPRPRSGNLHAFRIRVRELRSALQLFGDGSKGPVKFLGEVKDAIGEWHDWTVLAATVGDFGCGPRSEVMKEIRRTVRANYDHARSVVNAMRNKPALEYVKRQSGRSNQTSGML